MELNVYDRAAACTVPQYRGTSLIRNIPLLGSYSRTIPRVMWWSKKGGLFRMSTVLQYRSPATRVAPAQRNKEPKE